MQPDADDDLSAGLDELQAAFSDLIEEAIEEGRDAGKSDTEIEAELVHATECLKARFAMDGLLLDIESRPDAVPEDPWLRWRKS
jgi:hypothetical protein